MNTFSVKRLKEKKQGKPSIFIGSSRESLVIAYKIKSMFNPADYEVDIWDEDIFDPSIQKTKPEYEINDRLTQKIEYYLKKNPQITDSGNQHVENAANTPLNISSLKNFTDIYDFAIFVFVPEDKLISQSRGKEQEILTGAGTRHNVVFEFGMFLGRIGSKKTFIVADAEIKHFIEHFFTDLKGVKTYDYKGQYHEWLHSDNTEVLPYEEISLQEQVADIQKEILKTKAEIEIGFLPSTSLAIGFFENMMKLVIENLDRMRKGEVPNVRQDEKTVDLEFPLQRSEVILKLIVPDELANASHGYFNEYVNYYGMVRASVPTATRPITIFCHPEVLEKEGRLIIYDIPSTLYSSWNAINMLTQVDDIIELLNNKERENFKKAIPILVEKALASNKIKGLEHITIKIISMDDIAEDYPDLPPFQPKLKDTQPKQ